MGPTDTVVIVAAEYSTLEWTSQVELVFHPRIDTSAMPSNCCSLLIGSLFIAFCFGLLAFAPPTGIMSG
jgi:hypothetical protein